MDGREKRRTSQGSGEIPLLVVKMGLFYPPPLTTKTSPATLCSMWLHRKRFGGLLHLPLVTEDRRLSICEDFEPVLSKFGEWERAALTKRSA